ncbi:phage regulatory CII family protein [Nitratidesulfovibrio sp. 1201_IL3209]|uniref:phage regulatory CII family protein n=1 Tax=Nitratidesulfovibrio sp. 1201_IL3209 TaxID=3084053 RepID=UPI002FD8E1EB
MLSELTKIVHSIVLDSPTPAKALAKEIGKPYSTLLREINPYDTGAKLGVETLLEIMKHTGNIRPLEYMARQLGYRLEPDAGGAEIHRPLLPLRMSAER